MELPPSVRGMLLEVGTQFLKQVVVESSLTSHTRVDVTETERAPMLPGGHGCPYCAANDLVAPALSHLMRAAEVSDLELRSTHERLARAQLTRAAARLSVAEVVISEPGLDVLDRISAAAADADPDYIARARRIAAISHTLHELAERRNGVAPEEATNG